VGCGIPIAYIVAAFIKPDYHDVVPSDLAEFLFALLVLLVEVEIVRSWMGFIKHGRCYQKLVGA
jgi:hypothetical protein